MPDIEGFPAGDNLAKHWRPTGTEGRAAIPVRGLPEGVLLAWKGYRFREGSYSASYYGENHLGVFSRAGRRFLVTETYVDTSVTNSGRHVRKFKRVSRDGVCCTEIVRALEAGARLEFVLKDGLRRLEAVQERDHTFHEIEIETFRARAAFDLRRFTGTIERSRFRDAST